MFIKARGLQRYITGDSKKPVVNDSTYDQWDSDNSLVMSWLINSMQPRISRTYLLLDSTEKIWMLRFLKFPIKSQH
ncbi:hypothetical protein ES332_A10G001000v1 [Gossypium tomentosum]|uniref:Retrotransposon Copia-like N-terminal domain-containing protein n=1 Tax=Gossypium tomentosum TaxID=34277 RepID=A0A5D2NKG4_GOSTO|nr:hypothetical protein ES332_A10G001000v1 [Gossypium tomentosum]